MPSDGSTQYGHEGSPATETVAGDGSRILLPLSSAQRGMWFAENLSDGYSVNIAQFIDIRHEPGGLDLALLAECCEEVAKEVESPFARLTEVDGVPMQYVDVDFDQHADIYDLRDQEDPEHAASEWMKADYRSPVDLLNDQFVVNAFLRISDDRTFWYTRSHHIMLDGYAAQTVVRRIVDRYNALHRGDEPTAKTPATLAELVAYEDAYRESGRRETDRKHWTSRVADFPEPVTLARHKTAAPLVFDNVVAGGDLTPALQKRLEGLARDLNTSIAALLTSAFSAFLARMVDSDDVVLSLPVTGRASAKVKNAGGMLSNILPLRVDRIRGRTVRELISATQVEMLGALRHQRYRSEDIRRDAGLDDNSVSFGPTVNMIFFDEPIVIDGTTSEYRILTAGMLEDLLIMLYQADPQAPIRVDLHGNPYLYGETELERHNQRWIFFIEQFIDDLDRRVASIDLMLPDEESGVAAFEIGEPASAATDFVTSFRSTMAVADETVAMSYRGRTWTRRAVAERTLALTKLLVESGVRRGDAVGVELRRGPEQVIATYAVLLAGGVYVPIDPEQPAARRDVVAVAAGARVRVTADWLTESGFTAEPTGAAPDWTIGADLATSPLRTDEAAYVIFTSGSTGRPKGVEIPHGGLANFLNWNISAFGLDAADSILYKTPASFDASLAELLVPAAAGCRIVIAEHGAHGDADYLVRLARDEQVTVVQFVPTMLDLFCEVVANLGAGALPGLRLVFSGGERLTPVTAGRVRQTFSGARLVNVYGPTETVVDSTAAVIDDHVTIGRPVAGVRTRILDGRLREVPVGVPGELYLEGRQLALGYLGRSGETAMRFVASLTDPGRRMYRTGDLVRWSEAGEIEYLGRSDFQVKVRGQRVELGEIEAALLMEGSVEGCVVVVRHDTGSALLTAYVKIVDSTEDHDDVARRLESWCAKRLPHYMVPAAIVVVDEFPTGSSGKLDRDALPAPQVRVREFVAPASGVEIAVAEVLQELLSVDRIGMADNIFELGADSLVVARLRARLRAHAALDLRLADTFASRSVADLVTAVTPLASGAMATPLTAGPRPEHIPLSHAQNRLWFINRVDSSSAAYNIPGAVRLPGAVDVDAMRTAIGDLLARHESLRTRYPAVNGEPVQQVMSVDWAEQRCKLATVDVLDGDLDRALATEAAHGFDVASEPSVRFSLITVTDDRGRSQHDVLMVVLHHIVADGGSVPTLIKDLFTAYIARSAGHAPDWSPLAVQYADFALWQRASLGAADDTNSQMRRELDYWGAQLDGAPQVHSLLTDRPRPATASGAGGYVDTVFDAPTTARIRALAAECQVTPFTVLHAAFAAVLARLSGSDDILIGTAVAGQGHPDAMPLIGMFVNTVVLRTRFAPESTVADALRDAAAVRSEAMEHASAPFEQVVEALAVPRSLAHSPLFQISVTMVGDHRSLFAEYGVEAVDARVPAAKYDLSVTAVEVSDPSGDRLDIELSYSTDLFDRATVERIAAYLTRMVSAMTDDAQRRMGTIDLLAPEKVAALTAPVRGSAPVSLRDIVLEGESRGGGALVGDGRSLSSAEAASLTNRLARTLIARGAGPGVVVAMSMPRSLWSVIGTVAVIKTGAAFVTVDPRHPQDRRTEMLRDSGARLGLASGASAESVLTDGGIDWLLVDEDAALAADDSPVAAGDLLRQVSIEDTAYLIYTSGSTGLPKGTVVSHRGLANLIAAQTARLGLTASSRVLHVASPSFDASVFELTMALGSAAVLVIADAASYAGPDLANVITSGEVTHAVMTPSVLATLDPDAVPTLQTVMSAGEACPPELQRRWVAAGRAFFNLYGPTEATIWATASGPSAIDDLVTIGSSVDGVGALVLDTGLRPVPAGVPGELYLTGIQLADGYLHRPDLTAAAFVADPFDFSTRMYRTGDRVVRAADGALTYVGRTDFQLKVRGIRIEPGELDAVLTAHPAIRNALSIGATGPSGSMELVSYVALVEGAEIGADELVDHARRSLPAHLVPSAVTVVDDFPTTAVGKIDRRRLPAVTFETVEREFVEPRTAREAQVAEVFAQVLGLPRVGALDGFFDLGGNSLGAAKLATALQGVTGHRVPIHALLEASTVEAVAVYVDGLDASDEHTAALIARPRPDVVALSEVQRSMWLVNRMDPESPAFNIAFALRIEGPLDLDALGLAVRDLVDRQTVLRASYPMVDGDPVQILHPIDEVVAGLDLSPQTVVGELAQAIAAITGEGFDVTAAPPIRIAVLRTAPDNHVIVFVVHHINGDGTSMKPLGVDFMSAYMARRRGGAPAWTPLRVEYADFVAWQSERLGRVDESGRTERQHQLAYWRDRLAGAPEVIELPTDRPRPVSPTFRGRKLEFEVPAQLVTQLDEVARAQKSTLFMVTHTALAVLLSRLTGHGDVVVGTPYAGRSEPALDDLVGMFVNTLALRTRVDFSSGFDELLSRVSRDDLTDMENADVAFDSIVSEVGASRSTAYNPVYQVMFWFQNFEFPKLDLDDLTVSPVSEELDAAQADLRITLYPTDPDSVGGGDAVAGMRGEIVYSVDLFDEETAQRYAERYLRVLQEIADDPTVIVGDISIATAAEIAEADAADTREEPLPDLVRAAGTAAPEAEAFAHEGVTIAFGALSGMATAMAAALPDADAALVTALMSLVPTLAAAGPEDLGLALGTIRDNATRLRDEGADD